jgi:lipopolysaccharide/colanic/teichoic acid biosynthesis glycosyltransferase
MKRAFDIIFAMIGLVVFAPGFLIVALLILLEDGPPIVFVQERLGKKMKPFYIYKFRSMREGRVTKVGRWIRATGLDEVFQFLNILHGSMGVVGPRPLTREDVVRLCWHDITMARWTCKPGVTGLAQLYAGKGRQVSRFLDESYARNGSLWLDFQVMALSFLVNCFGKNRVRSALWWWRARGRNKRRAARKHFCDAWQN